MEQDIFNKLMAEVQKSIGGQASCHSRREMKCKVSSLQEKTSQDLTRRMASLSYQFKKKRHKHQFIFNAKLKDTLSSAKTELARVDMEDHAALRRVQAQLNEGLRTLTTRQKLIKIANRS